MIWRTPTRFLPGLCEMAAFFLVSNVVSASGSQPSLGRHVSHTLPVGVDTARERLWLVDLEAASILSVHIQLKWHPPPDGRRLSHASHALHDPSAGRRCRPPTTLWQTLSLRGGSAEATPGPGSAVAQPHPVAVAAARLRDEEANLLIARDELRSAKQSGDPVEVAEAKVAVAEAKLGIAKAVLEEAHQSDNQMKVVEAKAAVAKQEVAVAKQEAAVAKQEVAVAKQEAAVAEAKVASAGPDEKDMAKAGLDRAILLLNLAIRRLERADAAYDRALDAASIPPLCRLCDAVGARHWPYHHHGLVQLSGKKRKLADVFGSSESTTPANQCKASDAGKPGTVLRGFAYLPSDARFDPTSERRLSALVPSDCSGHVPWFPVSGRGPNFTPLSETDHVTPRLRTWLAAIGVQGETKMEPMCGLCWGSADGSVPYSGGPGGIAELKGAEASLELAWREASGHSSGVAMRLLQEGVEVDHVLVPVFACNGIYVQFGATFTLRPSMPVLCMVSKVLDLSDADENKIATHFLQKYIEVSKSHPMPTVPPGSQAHLRMELSYTEYWWKVLDKETVERGVGVFARPGLAVDVQVSEGFTHMARALNALAKRPDARAVTVFPLCVHAPTTSRKSDTRSDPKEVWYSLVFPNLDLDGFKTGIPDRQENKLYQDYVSAVEAAVGSVHAAGVAHLDLYPSNVFHRVRNGSVEVKIIDWDGAHLIGESFCGQHLRINSGTVITAAHDTFYIDALKKRGTEDIWKRLEVGNSKAEMDTAFFELLEMED